uniref:Uncharacterized protein n=1 Tax=Candidatus Kentrum sp. FW TaxID=2126338 RepID=A0A450SYF6_9GAMM|nr:MAG: hypothetical protein BECKFW1821B_GA0114236_10455 [Candidatus Kentron sp. FW]
MSVETSPWRAIDGIHPKLFPRLGSEKFFHKLIIDLGILLVFYLFLGDGNIPIYFFLIFCNKHVSITLTFW